MNLKRTVATAFGAALVSGGAQAAAMLQDWTLDLRNVDGLSNNSTYLIEHIDYAGFTDAPVFAQLNLGTMTYNIQGKGAFSSFSSGTGPIGVPLLNFNGSFMGLAGFELTFDFHVFGNIIDNTPNLFRFQQVSGLGFLNLYADNLSNGGKANAATGTGYNDGVLIASFLVGTSSNDGGVWNHSNTLDGADDLTFLLAANPLGLLKDNGGNPLQAGLVIGWSDANFDADSNNDLLLNETRGGFGCTANNQTTVSFCAVQDGSIRLATRSVPEPGTLALAALGLFGIATSLGRRTKALH